MFRGYLFDNNLNTIKQFAYPVEKHETEDTWFGAMVDVEGNIQTLVFSAADSWRKGTKIRIHTIPILKDELKSEEIAVSNKRLINFVLWEDTLSNVIQLQATATWQHRHDPFAGLAFVTFPLQRNGKVSYSSYDFTSDQKSNFVRSITNASNLLGSSVIELPLSFTKGGDFFTSMLIQSDYPGIAKAAPVPDNRAVSKLNELYMPDKTIYRGQGNTPFYAAPNTNSDKKQQDEINRLKKGFGTPQKNTNNISRSARLVVLKNTAQGTLESWDDKSCEEKHTAILRSKLFYSYRQHMAYACLHA